MQRFLILDRLLNTKFADVSAANDAARNIEIFHEGSGYKRNHDGDHIQPRGHNGDHRGQTGRSYESRSKTDRGYDLRGQSGISYNQRRQRSKGQDQRSTTRYGNDRPVDNNNSQRSWREQQGRSSQQDLLRGILIRGSMQVLRHLLLFVLLVEELMRVRVVELPEDVLHVAP
jgi:hypothetical protein